MRRRVERLGSEVSGPKICGPFLGIRGLDLKLTWIRSWSSQTGYPKGLGFKG